MQSQLQPHALEALRQHLRTPADPFASHPGLVDRLLALGVEGDEMLAEVTAPPVPLGDDFSEDEARLTELYSDALFAHLQAAARQQAAAQA